MDLHFKKKSIWFISFICVGLILYFIIARHILYTNKKAVISLEWKSEGEIGQPVSFIIDTSSIYLNKTDTSVTFASTERPAHWIVKPSMSLIAQEASSISVYLNSTQEKPSCHLPNLKPFDQSVLKYVRKPKKIYCETSQYPLLFKTDLKSNLIALKPPSDYDLMDCCYKAFIRKEFSETEVKYTNTCIPLTENITTVPSSHEYIAIFCNSINVNETMGYSNNTTHLTINDTNHFKIIDSFGFTPIKPEVENRIKKNYIQNNTNENISIIILGLDAMSHMNFIRTMPKTHKYLTNTLFGIGMNGFVKVGVNTFPNLVPLLTGLNERELESICWNNSNSIFDDCPFIWKKYSANGYRTSYGEDAAWMGAFNYMRNGFMNPPTDYYLRTLLYSQEETIGHSQRLNAKMCYGPRLAITVLLDNIKKMASTMSSNNMKNVRKYFQFIWTSTISHDYLNNPMLADDLVLSTLTFLNEGGFLNHTIFVLMSDHGIRWGRIRNTPQGKLEGRMPFVYFIFPKYFSEKYRSAVSNFKMNNRRLMTPFDLHETLNDLINPENTISENKIKIRHKDMMMRKLMSRGISLFLPIPLSRTCKLAHIPPHFCVCHPMVPILTSKIIVKKAASNIIVTLNTILKNYSQCSQLELFKIMNAEILKVENEDLIYSTDAKPNTITVTLQTVPGDAIFETTIIHEVSDEWKIEDITRINSYGNQSQCVSDSKMKMYCFC